MTPDHESFDTWLVEYSDQRHLYDQPYPDLLAAVYKDSPTYRQALADGDGRYKGDYRISLTILAEIGVDTRAWLTELLADTSLDPVMYYGPINPDQIDIAKPNLLDEDVLNELEMQFGKEHGVKPGTDEWYDLDEEFHEWLNTHGEWVDAEEFNQAVEYYYEDYDDDAANVFRYDPLRNQYPAPTQQLNLLQAAVDPITMKVIYHFDDDRIVLGTQADVKPGSIILGEYDGKDSVTLHQNEKQWLNANYFRRLWAFSFPSRPIQHVYFQHGQEENQKMYLPTRPPRHVHMAGPADTYMKGIYPNEIHNAGGDCPNPKCNYVFTPEDREEIDQEQGWFTCPQCHMTYNLFEIGAAGQGGYTRAQILTMTQMGQIGEQVIQQMGSIPNVGKVLENYGVEVYNNPIDFHIGPYGCEVKTIHSEATPRFKLTGGGARSRQDAIQAAVSFCNHKGLIPALVGVRLNFYTDVADIFFRQGLKDTWIGDSNHVGSTNFANLNPFKDPSTVPTPSELPNDDDIPW
jgi:hypothetical protein